MTFLPLRRIAVLCEESFFSSFSTVVKDTLAEVVWNGSERAGLKSNSSIESSENGVEYFVISTLSSLFSAIRAIAGGNFFLVVNLCSAQEPNTYEDRKDGLNERESIPPALVAHLLAQHQTTYTGCSSEALSYSLDLVWMMMWYAGIPLPPFCGIYHEEDICRALARLQLGAWESLPIILGKPLSVWSGRQCDYQTIFEMDNNICKVEPNGGERREGTHDHPATAALQLAFRKNGPLLILRGGDGEDEKWKRSKENEGNWETVDVFVCTGPPYDCGTTTSTFTATVQSSSKGTRSSVPVIELFFASVLRQSAFWKQWEALLKGYGEALLNGVLYGRGMACMTFSVHREAVWSGPPSASIPSSDLLTSSSPDCVLRDVTFNPSLMAWLKKTEKKESEVKDFLRDVLSGLCSSALQNAPQSTFAVRLHEDPRQGYRLCAARNLHQGEVVFEDEGRSFAIVTRPHVEAHWNEEQKKMFTEYAWPLDGEGHTYAIWDQHPSRWRPINHSCDPTCIFASPHSLNVIAARDIVEGEDLSIDYASFCDGTMKPFQCLCGARQCRGRIQADEKSLSKYGDHAWFRRVPDPVKPIL